MKPSHTCFSVAVRSQLGELGRFLGRMASNLAYVRINLRNLRSLQGSSGNGAQPRCDSLADWIVDLGPEGGDKGGEIVVCGTPEEVAEHPTSHTGRYLKQVLEQHPPEVVVV